MPENSGNRPLSPHLQVYRPQLTSVLSIMHRASGVLLFVSAFSFAIWLFILTSGEAHYTIINKFLNGFVMKFVAIGFLYSFFYHLCNGIRHLCWDFGWGFEISWVYRSGWLTVIVAVLLTVLSLFFLI